MNNDAANEKSYNNKVKFLEVILGKFNIILYSFPSKSLHKNTFKDVNNYIILMMAVSLQSLVETLEHLYPVTLNVECTGRKIRLNLIMIDQKYRHQGIGKKVMSRLIAYSEVHSMPIELTPSGKFGSKKRKLVKFYKNFGFVKNNSKYYKMIRQCS